jgi:predicted glycoside hydrolase/deacetylase ChbG (UPF0249 family)
MDSSETMIKELIINADDFGLKSSVNKAIVDSFNTGLINSATIMVNMPGFEEAVELAHKNKIISRIGVHLTLSAGSALTEEIVKSKLFYSGEECGVKKFKNRLFIISKSGRSSIYNEFGAQIEKARKAGIRITHVDTHHHLDDVLTITQIILALLKKHGIPSMRILNNLNRSTGVHKLSYRKLINLFIKSQRAAFSDYFGNQFEGISLLRSNKPGCDNKKLEIMVHPDISSEGMLVNKIQDQEIIFNYPDDIKQIIGRQTLFNIH